MTSQISYPLQLIPRGRGRPALSYAGTDRRPASFIHKSINIICNLNYKRYNITQSSVDITALAINVYVYLYLY